MENKRKFLPLASLLILFAIGTMVQSCSKNTDPITSEITQTVNNESTQDAQQDEIDDISTGQLNKADAASRMAGSGDDRVACAHIGIDTTSNKEQGSITIDFDENPDGTANPNGCTDGRGNVRKGSITISWANGRWFHFNSSITITMTNYSINGVVINGTRALDNITTDVTKPTWTVISSVTSAWPDNTTAMRTVTKTRQWDIAAGTITVTQTTGSPTAAAGTNRHGKTYTVQITEPLVYSALCVFINKVYIPVSGTKVITIDTSKVITIDFGSGSCDHTFTIMFDGKTDTITAKNDSSAD